MTAAGSPVEDIPTEIQSECEGLKLKWRHSLQGKNHPNIETLVLQVGGWSWGGGLFHLCKELPTDDFYSNFRKYKSI